MALCVSVKEIFLPEPKDRSHFVYASEAERKTIPSSEQNAGVLNVKPERGPLFFKKNRKISVDYTGKLLT